MQEESAAHNDIVFIALLHTGKSDTKKESSCRALSSPSILKVRDQSAQILLKIKQKGDTL